MNALDHLSSKVEIGDEILTVRCWVEDEEFEIKVQYSPFQVEQHVNGIPTLKINSKDRLYFANLTLAAQDIENSIFK